MVPVSIVERCRKAVCPEDVPAGRWWRYNCGCVYSSARALHCSRCSELPCHFGCRTTYGWSQSGWRGTTNDPSQNLYPPSHPLLSHPLQPLRQWALRGHSLVQVCENPGPSPSRSTSNWCSTYWGLTSATSPGQGWNNRSAARGATCLPCCCWRSHCGRGDNTLAIVESAETNSWLARSGMDGVFSSPIVSSGGESIRATKLGKPLAVKHVVWPVWNLAHAPV